LARIVVLDLQLFFNFFSNLKGTRRNDCVADATTPSLEAEATDTASKRDVIGIGETRRRASPPRLALAISLVDRRFTSVARGEYPNARFRADATIRGAAKEWLLRGRFDSFNRRRPNGSNPAEGVTGHAASSARHPTVHSANGTVRSRAERKIP
jgi:hypothetical protein